MSSTMGIPDWIQIKADGGATRCARCGAEEPTPFPITINKWIKRVRAFGAKHVDCPERPDGGVAS